MERSYNFVKSIGENFLHLKSSGYCEIVCSDVLTENSRLISLAKHGVYLSALVSDASPENRFIMWHLNISQHHTDLELGLWPFWATKIKVYPPLADWRIKEALDRLLYFSLRRLRWSNSCFSCNFKHLMCCTHNLVGDAWYEKWLYWKTIRLMCVWVIWYYSVQTNQFWQTNFQSLSMSFKLINDSGFQVTSLSEEVPPPRTIVWAYGCVCVCFCFQENSVNSLILAFLYIFCIKNVEIKSTFLNPQITLSWLHQILMVL